MSLAKSHCNLDELRLSVLEVLITSYLKMMSPHCASSYMILVSAIWIDTVIAPNCDMAFAAECEECSGPMLQTLYYIGRPDSRAKR